MPKVVDINSYRVEKINDKIQELKAVEEMFQYLIDFSTAIEDLDFPQLEDLCLLHGAALNVRINPGILESYYEVELDLNPHQLEMLLDEKQLFTAHERSINLAMYRLATEMKDYHSFIVKFYKGNL